MTLPPAPPPATVLPGPVPLAPTGHQRLAADPPSRATPGRRAPRARADAGSVTTELVLVPPLLVMLLLFVVLAGRYSGARNDVMGAARDAARAASIERSAGAADAAARTAATQSLARSGLPCADVSTVPNVSAFGPGGVVSVEVRCRIRLQDLGLLSIPGERVIRHTSVEPVDVYRSTG